MKIKELNKRPGSSHTNKLNSSLAQFDKLLDELRKRELPDELVTSINNSIEQVNTDSESEKVVLKQLRKAQSNIVKLVEKELKLVTKNHYRNTWLALGMAAFGLPIGTALGASLGNMAFLGVGLPIGMAIGMAVGSGLDKKAFKDGRQLDLELKQ